MTDESSALFFTVPRPSMTANFVAIATLACFFCAVNPVLAQDAGKEQPSMSQDITIRGKGAHGPALTMPPAVPESLIFNEVLQSLKLQQKEYQDSSSAQKAIRLLRKFPESPYLLFSPDTFRHPYQYWKFEVLQGDRSIKQLQGKGPLDTRIGWDGTNMEGQLVVRVDEAYRLKFTGTQDSGEEHTVASSLIMMSSLIYKPSVNYIYMDVANDLLFPRDGADLLETAPDYLHEMAAHMRQYNPREKPYRLILHQEDPDSQIARDRAAALKSYLSTELLVHPKKIIVEIQPITGRGNATTCILPSEYHYESSGE